MIFYTESQKANYTHIHAYAFYDLFLSETKRQNLTDHDFQINVDIDGSIATWTLDTTDSKIQNLFPKSNHQPKFHRLSNQ